MVRIGSLLLGLIFSGGAMLAAGAVAAPIKRSVSNPRADGSSRRKAPDVDKKTGKPDRSAPVES